MEQARLKPFGRAWQRYWIWHPLHGAAVHGVFRLLGLLSVDRASAFGGWLGRIVGPRLGRANRRALANLEIAFPELADAERRNILVSMWDHLGRVAAEYPHLERIRDQGRVSLRGARTLVAAYRSGKPIIFLSGHVGNWELAPILAAKFGVKATAVYRPPNNRFVDRLTRRIREACGLDLLERGSESTRTALSVLTNGGNLALLVDQRRDYGIPAPLFGRDAMTTSIPAQLALRYDCLIVPVRVERTGGARFRVTCHPPLDVPLSGRRKADVAAVTARINAVVEEWVRDRPAQWLWPHRRWAS